MVLLLGWLMAAPDLDSEETAQTAPHGTSTDYSTPEPSCLRSTLVRTRDTSRRSSQFVSSN